MSALFSVDEAFSKLGAKIVVCARKSYKGFSDDLKPEIDEISLQRISDHYFDYVRHWTKCESMILYVDDENINREVDEVLRFMGFSDAERNSMYNRLQQR